MIHGREKPTVTPLGGRGGRAMGSFTRLPLVFINGCSGAWGSSSHACCCLRDFGLCQTRDVFARLPWEKVETWLWLGAPPLAPRSRLLSPSPALGGEARGSRCKWAAGISLTLMFIPGVRWNNRELYFPLCGIKQRLLLVITEIIQRLSTTFLS